MNLIMMIVCFILSIVDMVMAILGLLGKVSYSMPWQIYAAWSVAWLALGNTYRIEQNE